MKKFELTKDFKMVRGKKVFRIKAARTFNTVKVGDLGGYVEKEENLSQDGDSWVFGNAVVYDNAKVFGNAVVRGNAEVYGNAVVYNNAKVGDNALVRDDVRVFGTAMICDDAQVFGNAEVYDNGEVYGNAQVHGHVSVCGSAQIYGNAQVHGHVSVCGSAQICDDADLRDGSHYTTISGFGSVFRSTTFFCKNDGGIGVKCGCFCGTLDEFRKKVVETHGDSKFAKEYLMIADLMETHFAKEV